MSQHWSASQFDDAFKPSRLNVWTPWTNKPSPPHGTHAMCLPTRRCPTEIIADDVGKLDDCITRGPSSPWGDYATSIWEDEYDCMHVEQIRHPEKYCCEESRKCIFVGPKEECCVCPSDPCACCVMKIGKGPTHWAPGEEKRIKICKFMRQRDCWKCTQLRNKSLLDWEYCCRIERLREKQFVPDKIIDWNCIRKLYPRRKPDRPCCPPLNATCCNQCPDQAVYCPCLNHECYIRRYDCDDCATK